VTNMWTFSKEHKKQISLGYLPLPFLNVS